MIKILVVEDEPHISSLLKATLEMIGYEVSVAQDGVEGLEKVSLEHPDLILLDVKMPRMNGWEVCEKLKSDTETKKIPFIIVTAYSNKESRQKSMDFGADDFLPKPFESQILIASVEKALKRIGVL